MFLPGKNIDSFIVIESPMEHQSFEADDLHFFITPLGNNKYYAIIKQDGEVFRKFKCISREELKEFFKIFDIQLHFFRGPKVKPQIKVLN